MRKVHLYLGLVMWPFVVLFAITALSFNHPATTRGLEQFRIPAGEVRRATGFEPPNARGLAEAIVEELNSSLAKPGSGTAAGGTATPTPTTTSRYRLEGSPSFAGWALFAAPIAEGKQTLILSLDSGWVDLTQRPAAANEEVAPFDGWRGVNKLIDFEALASGFGQLLESRGITALGPVRAHPEVHPELRLSLRDAQGTLWEGKFDLVSGELRATRAASEQGSFADVLERIHTQHHYPTQRDATWYWAFFADLTALTLLLWAVTGIAMWWQQRKLRKVGAWIVMFALLGTGLLMSSVVNHQNFGPASEPD